MRIGIRPINDFAYKKIFSSSENKLVLISLLNAILSLVKPIVDVIIVKFTRWNWDGIMLKKPTCQPPAHWTAGFFG